MADEGVRDGPMGAAQWNHEGAGAGSSKRRCEREQTGARIRRDASKVSMQAQSARVRAPGSVGTLVQPQRGGDRNLQSP